MVEASAGAKFTRIGAFGPTQELLMAVDLKRRTKEEP
jgi:hypothetical protein